MKYDYETEDEFRARQKEAKERGECVFRDDANREFILDIIDDYMDVVDSLLPNNNCGSCGYWLVYGEPETPFSVNEKILLTCEQCRAKKLATEHIAKIFCDVGKSPYKLMYSCSDCIMNGDCLYQKCATAILDKYTLKKRKPDVK